MKTFNKLQSMALWMHIPMWGVCALVIIIIGAYNAGMSAAATREAVIQENAAILPILTLRQLQKIPVSRDL